MQLSGIVPTVKLDPVGLGMSVVIIPSTAHQILLIQLVKENEPALSLADIIIDPHFVFRHILVHMVMTAGSELHVKPATHQPSIDDPDSDT